MTQPSIQHLLAELKQELGQVYRMRLVGVFLFGSYARGEQENDSDVDILIVLDRIDHYHAEIQRTSEMVSRLSLQHGVSISRKFLSEASWRTSSTALVRNARAEAIAA